MVMCFRNNDSLKLGRRDLFSGLRPISPGKSGRSWLQALHKIGQGFQQKKNKKTLLVRPKTLPKNTSENLAIVKLFALAQTQIWQNLSLDHN